MNDRIIEIENYWTRVVRDTAEFQQIADAENPEFNTVLKCLYNILKDGFINDLTENGAMRWEKILGLPVAPDATLEERKVQILTYLSIRRPYTWRVLKQMLTGLLGEDKFEISLDNDTQTLTVKLASTVKHLREKIDELCARVIPQNLVIKMQWINGLPIDYTPLEYLESTGTQMMSLPFEAKGKEFECEHDAGLPTTNAGLYTYGGRSVSGGYGWRWHANSQNLQFSQTTERLGFLARGTRHKIKWVVSKAESGFYFAMYADSNFVIQIKQNYNQYWENAYYLFSSTYYSSVIGGRAYDLKIKIGDYYAHYIPALDPTGAPCMFDLVTRTPFYNSGTGDFIYPTDAAPVMTLDLDEKFYAKMTEHGIRRLYHVPEGCTMSKDEYAAKNGFKEILEPPMPQEGYWVPEWRETETQLICEWVETEPPTEEGIEND